MNKKTAADKCAELLELPQESFSDALKVTVTSNSGVEIDNYKSLIELSDKTIGVRGARMLALVRGSDLELAAMTDRHMLIYGHIQAVELEDM